LPCKKLDVSARKWSEAVRLQKIKDALPIEVGDDANVIAEVETMPKVNAFVPVLAIILSKS
jgi:hypothetical protein